MKPRSNPESIKRRLPRTAGPALALIASALSILAPVAFGATPNPIQWILSADTSAVAPGATVLLKLHAKVGGRVPRVLAYDAGRWTGPNNHLVSAKSDSP